MNTMKRITIPFGKDHARELLAFVGAESMPRPFNAFREHGHEHLFYRIGEYIFIVHTDKYTDHSNVTRIDGHYTDLFAYRKALQGNHDIENGGAAFGYHRSPSSARDRIEAEIEQRKYDQQEQVNWWAL